jgi:hypothetical protein
MTTMIERVARAIAKSQGVEDTWRGYMAETRAAIAAMREPTEAMAHAGDQHAGRDAWQAMIDAALKEEPR